MVLLLGYTLDVSMLTLVVLLASAVVLVGTTELLANDVMVLLM